MTVSLITEGLIGGAASDASPPVIAAVTPTPNTTPGAGGGMSATYSIARVTPVVVSLTDTDGAANVAYIAASAVFLDGTVETVYAGSNFVGEYLAGSVKTSITNGFQLSIVRHDGWPGAGALSNLAVGILLDAVDAGGNVTTSAFYYEMPPATPITPPAPPPEPPVVGAMDVTAGALSRLVSQLRSS